MDKYKAISEHIMKRAATDATVAEWVLRWQMKGNKMTKFIKLTEATSGLTLYVNTDIIEVMIVGLDGITKIQMRGGDEPDTVTETPEEILAMIEGP